MLDYVQVYFTGWRIDYKEIVYVIILTFYMSAITKTKTLDSAVISVIIMVILYVIAMPAIGVFVLLNTVTDYPAEIILLLSSIPVILLQVGILVTTYKVKLFRNGISFLLEKLGEMGVTTHGTGVGWPTVINIVKAHGGTYKITPHSDKKYGKTIKISFN